MSKIDPALAVIDAVLTEVRQHREAGRMDLAVNQVAAVVRSHPQHGPALRLMASLAMQTGTPQIAVGCLARAHAHAPRDLQVALDYGEALLAAEKPVEAEHLFRHALALRSKDGTAFRGLAQAQLDQGKTELALKSFRKALSALPYDRYAAHMVTALSGESGTLSTSYVPDLFDKYAETFDEHLTGTLDYGIPEKLRSSIAPLLDAPPVTLDLGCGTGLVGQAMSGVVAAIDGVDISPLMVEKAAAKTIYRHLRAGDYVQVLQGDPHFVGPYQLVTAADVFIYVGPLELTFASVAKVLASKGLFAFSVEASDGQDVAIRSSGRYAHAPTYIAALANRHGLSILQQDAVPIRLERNRPIKGYLFVLQAA